MAQLDDLCHRYLDFCDVSTPDNRETGYIIVLAVTTIAFSLRTHLINRQWFAWIVSFYKTVVICLILKCRHAASKNACQLLIMIKVSAAGEYCQNAIIVTWTWQEGGLFSSSSMLGRESRSHVTPRVEVPGDKIKTRFFGVYRPRRPKSAIPHPITIHNMRFER